MSSGSRKNEPQDSCSATLESTRYQSCKPQRVTRLHLKSQADPAGKAGARREACPSNPVFPGILRTIPTPLGEYRNRHPPSDSVSRPKADGMVPSASAPVRRRDDSKTTEKRVSSTTAKISPPKPHRDLHGRGPLSDPTSAFTALTEPRLSPRSSCRREAMH